MRISTGYQFDTYSSQIATSQSRMFDLQQQVQTGKRINVASDDPIGTSTVLSLRSLQTASDQYMKNLQMAKGYLGFTEDSLGEIASIMRHGYEMAVRGANTTTDQIGRNAMAAEVADMQQRLVDLANSRGPTGEYIYAGQAIDQKPFSVVAGALVFAGDTNAMNVEIAPTETMRMNTEASGMFITAYQQLEDLKNNLTGGNIGALSGISVGDLKASQDTINMSRGAVGSKLQTVDAMTENYTRRIDEFTKSISDTEEIDVTEAILKYKQAEMAYQAALQVASQGFGLSLMDFIGR